MSASNNIALITRREVTSRIQQRSFRIGLLITLVIIGIVAVLPRFIGSSGRSTFDVAISGSNANAIGSTVQRLADERGDKVILHPALDAVATTDKVRKGEWDAALLDGSTIIAKSTTSTPALLLNTAYQAVIGSDRLQQAGVDPDQVSKALAVAPLPVTTTGNDGSQRQIIATLTVVVLFAQLIGFCSWVSMGVVEEKASRVVELILSTVRPWQLLAGKLIGIGLIAIGQLTAYAVVGLGVAASVGRVHLPPGAVGAIALSVGWFVLAFGFFAALSAALGSLVSRQEEVSGVMAPVTALLMISYFIGFTAVGSPDSTLARVTSFIPPVSAIVMPARIIRGGVPTVEVVISVVVMLAVTIGVLGLAAKIYRAAVLHTGSKLSLGRAWRAEAAADLD